MRVGKYRHTDMRISVFIMLKAYKYLCAAGICVMFWIISVMNENN